MSANEAKNEHTPPELERSSCAEDGTIAAAGLDLSAAVPVSALF